MCAYLDLWEVTARRVPAASAERAPLRLRGEGTAGAAFLGSAAMLLAVVAALARVPGSRHSVKVPAAAEHEQRNHTHHRKQNARRTWQTLDPTASNDAAAQEIERGDKNDAEDSVQIRPDVLSGSTREASAQAAKEVKEATQEAINATSNAAGQVAAKAEDLSRAVREATAKAAAETQAAADAGSTPSEAAREAASEAGRIIWKGLSGMGDAEEGESQATA